MILDMMVVALCIQCSFFNEKNMIFFGGGGECKGVLIVVLQAQW